MKTKLISGTMVTALVLGAAIAANALDGAGGSSVTTLFTVSDVSADVVYPAGFVGVEWADTTAFSFGSPAGTAGYEQGDDLAADAAGGVYVIVNGTTSSAALTGLVGWDGTTFTHLVQDAMTGSGNDTTGDMLRTVSMSPATAGALTAGHPVITRHHKTVADEVHLEIWSVDPSSGEETFVHSWTTSALNPEAILAIADDGTIYLLAAINAPAGSIRKLTWNSSSSSYAESILTDGDFGGGLVLGSDGDLYTFAKGDRWQTLSSPYPDHAVLRVDPTTGASGTFAYVDGESFVFDWTLGTDGKLWTGLRQRSKNRKKAPLRYVAEISSGSTAGPDGRISSSSDDPRSLAAASGGALYVLERAFEATGAVYLLTPGDGSGSGGGGKGGGNGGGKGKNK